MLFVHELMGDGAPGEVDPAALGPDVAPTTAASPATRPATTARTACRSTCPRRSRWRGAGDGRRCASSRDRRAVPNLRLT